MFRDVAAAQSVFLFGQHHDGAAFRRFVGQARKLRRVGQLFFGDAVDRQEFHRLAVAERDGAGLVEQQRIDVARRFHRLAAHGEHVVLHHAIHARDADGGEQAADGGRDQADQQRDQHRHGGHRARAGLRHREHRIRLQRDHRQQEDQRQAGDQNIQRDFIRRLLPLRAFHQRDHAVEKRFAGIGSDLDLDLIRQHSRAAGDRAAVAAGFANDRRAFARDDGFIDGRDAFDHVAIAGDQVARVADDDIAGAQHGRTGLFDLAGRRHAFRQSVGLRLAQAVGLSFAARFRHRFGEVREQHREPEPQRDLE